MYLRTYVALLYAYVWVFVYKNMDMDMYGSIPLKFDSVLFSVFVFFFSFLLNIHECTHEMFTLLLFRR